MRNRPATSSANANSESSRKILEGIAVGERAFADGRVVTHDDAQMRLKRWLKEPITEPAIDECERRDHRR